MSPLWETPSQGAHRVEESFLGASETGQPLLEHGANQCNNKVRGTRGAAAFQWVPPAQSIIDLPLC